MFCHRVDHPIYDEIDDLKTKFSHKPEAYDALEKYEELALSKRADFVAKAAT